jgi:MFS family permease
MVEWYDFFLFASASVLVFNKVFYPNKDPYVSVLVALATFAVGFLARPFGGLLFGVIGDKTGRKNTLVVTLLIMGGSTMAMGLLPTYAQIGLGAPALLVLLRVLQGVAVGGEATGALLLVAESMPPTQRGFWTSFPLVSGPAANVLAVGVMGVVQGWFGEAAFLTWAWRIPFLLSAVLIVLGIWARRSVVESPAFAEISADPKRLDKAPLRHAFSNFKRPMGQVFLVKAAENTLLYLFSTFFLVLATMTLGVQRQGALDILFRASLVELPIVLIAAAVSDKVGRRPVMMVGMFGAVVASFALFTQAKGGGESTLQWLTIGALGFHGVILGGMAAFVTELFPTRVRYTALSAGYQFASVVGGSVAPLIGTLLLQRTGHPILVAVYAALMVVPAIICVLLSHETRHIDITAG